MSGTYIHCFVPIWSTPIKSKNPSIHVLMMLYLQYALHVIRQDPMDFAQVCNTHVQATYRPFKFD